MLRAKGKFRKQRITPMVGDRIRYTPGEGEEHGWVEEILPRESELVRPRWQTYAILCWCWPRSPRPIIC